jgi:hypothetical protein
MSEQRKPSAAAVRIYKRAVGWGSDLLVAADAEIWPLIEALEPFVKHQSSYSTFEITVTHDEVKRAREALAHAKGEQP